MVLATHNRRAPVLQTVGELMALPERPPVIVVDNGSTDGTAQAVRRTFPRVDVVALPRNRGAAARNVGVARSRSPYVAFSDDDSWWRPGALGRAAAHFDAAPRVGLLAARILVGDDHRRDPTCDVMAASPLPREPDLPGPAVRGFVACGAVVRRTAFLAVGGFDPLVFFLGEERTLAIDLASAGWGLAYVDDVVAVHHPQRVSRDDGARRRLHARNELLVAWMRRPVRVAVRQTARTVVTAVRDRDTARGAGSALRRCPDALAYRRPVPRWLERQLRCLEETPA